MTAQDKRYLDIVLNPIRVCAKYKPKFGQGQGAGLTLDEFQALYRADPFYAWFGLDNPLMYAAHKAAGGMTSIYRQIGIGCEKLFRTAIQEALDLAPDDVKWSYQVPVGSAGKVRTLSLDGRIPFSRIPDPVAGKRLQHWIQTAAHKLEVTQTIADSLTGVVFEVRQGYKSKDSKRQNADIANAASAYTKAYLPCAVILSSQIDNDIMLRYTAEKWIILIGTTGGTAYTSTYEFMRSVIGYDLASFFQRHNNVMKSEVDIALKRLLTPDPC